MAGFSALLSGGAGGLSGKSSATGGPGTNEAGPLHITTGGGGNTDSAAKLAVVVGLFAAVVVAYRAAA